MLKRNYPRFGREENDLGSTECLSSVGFVDWYVSDREFISALATIIAVINSSSVTSAFPCMALIAVFADLITNSCTPQEC